MISAFASAAFRLEFGWVVRPRHLVDIKTAFSAERVKVLTALAAFAVTLLLAAPAGASASGSSCRLQGKVPGLTGSGQVLESATVTCANSAVEQVEVCPWYKTSTGRWTQITSECKTVTQTAAAATATTAIPAAVGGSYRAWTWAWTWPLCGATSRASSSAEPACGKAGAFSTAYVSASVPGITLRPVGRQTFWDSTLALVIVIAACALLLCIPIWFLVRGTSRPAGVSELVSGFVSTPTEEAAPPISLADTAARRTRATFSKSSWWPAFVEALDIAMIGQAPEKVILYTGVGACLLAALVWFLIGSVLVAVLPVLVAPFALRSYLQLRVKRQRKRFSELLPSHIEEVAVSIRAGRSLIEALNVVAEGAEEPVHREFDRALRDEDLGRPLEEALRVIYDRMNSESVEQVAVVAAMHRRTGSSVSEALDRVAEGARERADLQGELSALTAQGRLARWILTFMPPVILLVMQLVSPNYVKPLLHTVGGIVALVIAAVMVIAGSLVMKKIVDVEV